MARVAKVEQQPAPTGATLVVAVGLGVAFLLFMAFLNVVKNGTCSMIPIFSMQP